jgi:hypothetical protein
MYKEVILTNEYFNLLCDLWPYSKTLTFAAGTWIVCATLPLTMEYIRPKIRHACRINAPNIGFVPTPSVTLSNGPGLWVWFNTPLWWTFLSNNFVIFKEWARYRLDKPRRTHIHQTAKSEKAIKSTSPQAGSQF